MGTETKKDRIERMKEAMDFLDRPIETWNPSESRSIIRKLVNELADTPQKTSVNFYARLEKLRRRVQNMALSVEEMEKTLDALLREMGDLPSPDGPPASSPRRRCGRQP